MLRANLAAALLLCGGATPARADLPSELVARPATLPHGMSSLSLSGGHDEAHVLGIRVVSATGMGLEARRGMTRRLELAVGIGLALDPDQAWTSHGDFGVTYAAWHGAKFEVAPSLDVPLWFDRGVDLTSTLALGPGLRWRPGSRALITIGRRLVRLPVRPAVGFDVGFDAEAIVQLDSRWALAAQASFGELTVVGQFDRGVAPWHHLPSVVRIVYASCRALDLALEVHGDARDPRNEVGAAIVATRRVW